MVCKTPSIYPFPFLNIPPILKFPKTPRLKPISFSFSQDERHSYEKCQYEEFKKRVAKMDELRASKGGARSN